MRNYMKSVGKSKGLHSTEFILTLVLLVAATVLAGLGVLDADAWMVVAGGTVGGYSVSRGLAKR